MSTITCPECGKELQVNDPSRSFIFCRHCGTKIAVDAFRSTHASCNSQDPHHHTSAEVVMESQ